ncbi:acetylcholine receptor subunit beta-type unc-29-like [Mercenaria mercenaria]|uniref:acetylcholine receptor subunit beta-type unc-29-like n=1 Tax=Mercenaria mercenaria TaxID=6596 RepID=UPI00234E79A4|nr:acetylcholine receptor subunit beta-type unc-29-like [Mercenaria mercenaria]
MNETFFILMILTRFLAMTSATLSNATNILHQVLLDGYNTDIRPCLDCPTPLYIGVSYHLTALINMDELEGELHSVGYLEVVWVDERLRWNPLVNGIGSVMFSPNKIWVPPLILGNPSREISRLNADRVLARVLYNGTVIWHPGDVFNTRCSYDIYRYPFDKQMCWIAFTPWSYQANEIRLYSAGDKVETPYYKEHGQWKLGSLSASDYISNDVSFVQFDIWFTRRSGYFVVNIILPICLLAFLNCLAFVIPAESGERISYTVTMLLSFAVFMTLVSDNVPKTSAPMSLLCYFLLALFNGSVFIMICVMLNLRLFYRESSTKMSSAYTLIYKMATCCKIRKTNVSKTRKNKIASIQKEIKGRQFGHEMEEPFAEASWQDVAGVFDKICFILSLMYFISITVAILII